MSVDRLRPAGDSGAIRTMTTVERDALTSVPTNRTIFNTTTLQFERYTGSAWVTVTTDPHPYARHFLTMG